MLLLGIDAGTTVLKAAVFSATTGKLIAADQVYLPVIEKIDGTREQNPSQISQALKGLLQGLRQTLGDRWKQISGVGLATQGGSSLIVNKETGKPLSPMILWNDSRAFTEFSEISASHPKEYWRSFSLRDEPGMGLARLRWLQKRHPDWFCSNHLHVGLGEYLTFQFTGEWRQDPCHALQTGNYDVLLDQLTDVPLSLVNLPLSFFAPLREGYPLRQINKKGQKLLSLDSKIPFSGPMIDQEATYLSVRMSREKVLHASLGTAWVGNFSLDKTQNGYSPFQLVIPSPDQAQRLVIQPLLTGNLTWDWALRSFISKDLKTALLKYKQVFKQELLPPEGLVALPWLNRPNPFLTQANGAGVLFGLSPQTTQEDQLQAVALGMSYEFYRMFAALTENRLIDCLVLTGGASKAPHFQTYLASLFDPLPVYRTVNEDWCGAKGSLYPYYLTTGGTPERVIEIKPQRKLQNLEKSYELYCRLFEKLYGAEPAGNAYQVT
jgi:sugar (pentulose or hexulose) kinase